MFDFTEPLISASTGLTAQLRRMGLLPRTGITPQYGGIPETGQRKLRKVWSGLGILPFGPDDFAYTTGRGRPYSQPSYKDAQGNIYDAVSGRLLYPGKTQPGTGLEAAVNTLSSSKGPLSDELAYQSEKSRVAQMSEQDPLFKKYRVAELTKAYNTASPEDKEKIGLEIWATTNPQLAQKLKPGQLGYTQATSAVMSQSPLGQFQAQTGDMQYANKMDQVPGAMARFQPQTPLTGIPTPAAPQFGASEAFAKSTPIPGATEMFTDPRKFLSQEELSQTQLALLKKAFESRIK